MCSNRVSNSNLQQRLICIGRSPAEGKGLHSSGADVGVAAKGGTIDWATIKVGPFIASNICV